MVHETGLCGWNSEISQTYAPIHIPYILLVNPELIWWAAVSPVVNWNVVISTPGNYCEVYVKQVWK